MTFLFFNLCCFQARENRGWFTSASTSAFPATSACPSAFTTFQSDCVFTSCISSKKKKKKKDQGNKVVFSVSLQKKKNK